MELCDKYLHEQIKLNPTLNDYFCFKEYENRKHIMPNYWSYDYSKSQKNLGKKYLKILNKKKDKNLYDKILERNLLLQQKYDKFKIYDYLPISSQNNIFYNICTEINGDYYFKINNKSDIEDYIKRLKVLNSITDDIIKQFKNGIKNNVTMYYENIDYIISTLEDIIKKESYKFKKNIPLKNKLNAVIEEYYVKNVNKLLTFLLKEYYPHASKKLGLCQYKDGKSLYKLIVQDNLYDFATPENIHELGISEVKRIDKDIKELIQNHKKEWNYYENHYKPKTSKQILSQTISIKEKLYKNMNKYFHDNLKKSENYDVKRVDIGKDSTGYYYPSDFKRKKKGTFYINVDNQEINHNELLVLSLHEGMPGHHYQLEKTNNNEKLPLYIRYYDSTAYVEGWGLYSESLYEYDNFMEYYFKLKYELLRSIRLVVDTGIHYYGWSKEECLKYNNKYLPNISSEYKRYSDDPGQGLCYKMGELTINFLRDKYLESDPNGLKDFHEIILNIGPIPLTFLISECKKKFNCKL